MKTTFRHTYEDIAIWQMTSEDSPENAREAKEAEHSLDSIVEGYETNWRSRFKAKAAHVYKKVSKRAVQIMFWGLLGTACSYINWGMEKDIKEFQSKKPESTEFHMRARHGSANLEISDIFFEEQKPYEEIKKFLDACKVHENAIAESHDQNRLAVSIPPITVKSILEKNKFNEGTALSSVDLEAIIGKRTMAMFERDIYIISKDGSEFYNLTNMPGHEVTAMWLKGDRSIAFRSRVEGEKERMIKMRLSDRTMVDVPSGEDMLWQTLWIYLLTLGGGLAGIVAYDRIKRRKDEPTRSARYSIVQHYNLSTLTHTAAVLGGMYHLYDTIINTWEKDIPENLLIYPGLAVASLSAILTQIVLSMFKDIKPPYLKNMMKVLSAIATGFVKDPDKNIKRYMQIRPLLRDPDSAWLEVGTQALYRDDRREGLQAFQKMFKRMIARNYQQKGLFEIAVVDPVYNPLLLIASKLKRGTVYHPLMRMYSNMGDGDYCSAFRKWDSITDRQNARGQIERNFNEVNYLYGMFLDEFLANAVRGIRTRDEVGLHRLKLHLEEELGKRVKLSDLLNEKITRQWQKTIDCIVTDSSIAYSSLGGSRAYIVSNNELLGGSFVFKQSDIRDELEAERDVALRLGELVADSEEYGVAIPLRVVEMRDSFFYISRFAEGVNVGELEGEAALDSYQKIAKYLALVHSRMKSSKGNRDLRKVIQNRMNLDGFREDVIGNWDVVWKSIDGDYVFDKDAHPYNWIRVGDGKIIAIDNTDKGHVPYQFDLAKLIERSPFFEAHPERKQEVLDEYLRARGKEADSGFEASYHNSAIAMAINYHIYDPIEGIDRLSLGNAIRSIDILRTKHVERYSQKDLAKYERLKATLQTELDKMKNDS